MAYNKNTVDKLSFALSKDYTELLDKESKQNKRSRASQTAYIIEKYLDEKYKKGDNSNHDEF